MTENPNAVSAQLSPLPVDVQVSQVQGADGLLWVRMVCTTPAGVNAYFFPGAIAEQLGEGLVKLGRLTKAGLVNPSQNGG